MIAITGWECANFTLMGKIIEEIGYKRTMIPYSLNRGDTSKGTNIEEHKTKYCIDPLFCFYHQDYDISIKYLIQVESPKHVYNELPHTTLELWYFEYSEILKVSKNNRFLYSLEELIDNPKSTLNRLSNFLRLSFIDNLSTLCEGHIYDNRNEYKLTGKYTELMAVMRNESHREIF